MDREFRRSLLILGAVILVTAWFSVLFYFPDEHYQVLEFMSYRLGITPASGLPWEFSARIRPWFQPLLYFLIAKPLLLLGVRDMFTIVFVLRLATGLFSLALAMFARAVPAGEEKRAFGAICHCSVSAICSCGPRRKRCRRPDRLGLARRWTGAPPRAWCWQGCAAAWRPLSDYCWVQGCWPGWRRCARPRAGSLYRRWSGRRRQARWPAGAPAPGSFRLTIIFRSISCGRSRPGFRPRAGLGLSLPAAGAVVLRL